MNHSYNKGNFLQRKQELEPNLAKWLKSSTKRKAQYGDTLSGLNKLIKQDDKQQARDLILGYMRYSKMLSTAKSLHRLAIENTKPNIERDRGYQERDIARFEQGMKAVNRRYDAEIDQKIVLAMFKHYVQLPKAQRLQSLDMFFGVDKNFNEQQFQAKLEKMYQKTALQRVMKVFLKVMTIGKQYKPRLLNCLTGRMIQLTSKIHPTLKA